MGYSIPSGDYSLPPLQVNFGAELGKSFGAGLANLGAIKRKEQAESRRPCHSACQKVDVHGQWTPTSAPHLRPIHEHRLRVSNHDGPVASAEHEGVVAAVTGGLRREVSTVGGVPHPLRVHVQGL